VSIERTSRRLSSDVWRRRSKNRRSAANENPVFRTKRVCVSGLKRTGRGTDLASSCAKTDSAHERRWRKSNNHGFRSESPRRTRHQKHARVDNNSGACLLDVLCWFVSIRLLCYSDWIRTRKRVRRTLTVLFIRFYRKNPHRPTRPTVSIYI